ncbi:SAM-dependent methyltransferase [Nonomuraea sp. K274]|uniref:SAM-dependent methyltransferase n=1 Tax=Nonomuraea cypriaca TaxID=1187855 RepID=A0A931AHF9_9ACTN|nr:SAM-dependent methyltransferase [Nonomuraea cypriaca]MBF8190548.1 SAM-dependent methyltransferase [Nonomuraea cypriaca]
MDSAPEGVDPNVPNVARMYDYYLDGKDNFAADRAAAEQILKTFPDTKAGARSNRAFLRRAVRHVVDAGVRQIVDLGAGLPTQGNTHEIAPEARVVYVDYDSVVCVHGRALLARKENVDFVQADVRDPDALLDKLGGLIDFDRPVAFLMLAILHFIPDDIAYGAVTKLREASAPGSHLVLSHAVDSTPDTTPQALEIYKRATAALNLRTKEGVLRFFDGYELAEPGLTYPNGWRPDDPDAPGNGINFGYVGVGRKL